MAKLYQGYFATDRQLQSPDSSSTKSTYAVDWELRHLMTRLFMGEEARYNVSMRKIFQAARRQARRRYQVIARRNGRKAKRKILREIAKGESWQLGSHMDLYDFFHGYKIAAIEVEDRLPEWHKNRIYDYAVLRRYNKTVPYERTSKAYSMFWDYIYSNGKTLEEVKLDHQTWRASVRERSYDGWKQLEEEVNFVRYLKQRAEEEMPVPVYVGLEEEIPF